MFKPLDGLNGPCSADLIASKDLLIAPGVMPPARKIIFEATPAIAARFAVGYNAANL